MALYTTLKLILTSYAQKIKELASKVDILNDGGLELKDEVLAGQVADWLDEHPEASTTIQDGAVTDSKFAPSLTDIFYDEITVTKVRHNETDCYVAVIPKVDSDGNQIELYLDLDDNRNPLEYADYIGSTLTINGNASVLQGSSHVYGTTIVHGVAVNKRSFSGAVPDNLLYLGITANREILEYAMNGDVTWSKMLSDGCVSVFGCYFKILNNSVVTDPTTVTWNNYTPTETDRNPLMIMGVKDNGDIVFMACDGRITASRGLTYREAAEYIRSLGCTDAYNLDGGGSTCMVYKGSKINRNADGDGTVIRNIKYTLNVVKSGAKNSIAKDLYEKIGYEKQSLIEHVLPMFNTVKAVALTLHETSELSITKNSGSLTAAGRISTLNIVFTISADVPKNTTIFSFDESVAPTEAVSVPVFKTDGDTFKFATITTSGNINPVLSTLPAGTYRLNATWQY